MIKSCVTISLVPSLAGGPWIYWDELEVSIGKAKSAGFDAVELYTASADAIHSERLADFLQEYNVALAGVGTGAGRVLHGLSLTDLDETIRKKAVAFAAEMIVFGARFGAPAIIGSMQGFAERTTNKEQAVCLLSEGLTVLAKEAADCGVDLIIEPLNRYETNLVNTLADGVELIKSLDADNVYLLTDLFHMNIEEASICDSIRAGGEHIGYVHFVDSNRRAAGMGHIDLSRVSRALWDIGFDGYASAEALPWPDSDVAAAQTMAAFHQFLIPP